MANIQKRILKDGTISFRVQVRMKGHPAQVASFTRLTDAKKWAEDTQSAIRNGRHFKSSTAKRYTLEWLIDKYTREVLDISPKPTRNQRLYLGYWKQTLGDYALSEVTRARISEYRNKIIGSANQYGKERGLASANRYTEALGAMLEYAMREWEFIEQNPVRSLKKLKEPRGRVRFLNDIERSNLLEMCRSSTNPFLHIIVVLALSTGARKNEILSLKWQDVDFERRRMIFHETKNGERRSVPLQGCALGLMLDHTKNRRNDTDYVFPAKGRNQPVDIRTAWENAVKNASITDFRFHDLRHSCASYLAMNNASLTEIAEVLGHKTLQMVRRYAHISECHTAGVVARMNEKVFG